MWPFQSRASRKRDRAEAEVLRLQAKRMRSQDAADDPLLLQPTMRDLIRTALRRGRRQQGGPGGAA